MQILDTMWYLHDGKLQIKAAVRYVFADNQAFLLQGPGDPDKDRRLHQCAPPTGVLGRVTGRWNVHSHPHGQSGSHSGCGSDVTLHLLAYSNPIGILIHMWQLIRRLLYKKWPAYIYCGIIFLWGLLIDNHAIFLNY